MSLNFIALENYLFTRNTRLKYYLDGIVTRKKRKIKKTHFLQSASTSSEALTTIVDIIIVGQNIVQLVIFFIFYFLLKSDIQVFYLINSGND